MEEQKFKELIEIVKASAKNELEYSKLTLAEQLSVIMSRALIIMAVIVFAACVLFLLMWGVTKWLVALTGSMWLGVLASIAILLLLLLVLYGYRKQLVINPVTRFVTKLLLKPEE